MKSQLYILVILTIAGTTPALAQRTHPGGGPPPGAGASGSHGSATTGADGNSASANHVNTMHSSPNEVLTHNTAIADKIKTLTGEDATSACNGFKNLGQCVANRAGPKRIQLLAFA